MREQPETFAGFAIETDAVAGEHLIPLDRIVKSRATLLRYFSRLSL
jgi:hypothetical protein